MYRYREKEQSCSKKRQRSSTSTIEKAVTEVVKDQLINKTAFSLNISRSCTQIEIIIKSKT